MSAFTVDQIMTLTEILVTLGVLGITWAIYFNSDRAELPGEAQIPDPRIPEEPMVDTEGRTL